MRIRIVTITSTSDALIDRLKSRLSVPFFVKIGSRRVFETVPHGPKTSLRPIFPRLARRTDFFAGLLRTFTSHSRWISSLVLLAFAIIGNSSAFAAEVNFSNEHKYELSRITEDFLKQRIDEHQKRIDRIMQIKQKGSSLYKTLLYIEGIRRHPTSPLLIDNGRLFFLQPDHTVTVLSKENGDIIKRIKGSSPDSKYNIPLQARKLETIGNIIIGVGIATEKGFILHRDTLEILYTSIDEHYMIYGKYIIFRTDLHPPFWNLYSQTLIIMNTESLTSHIITDNAPSSNSMLFTSKDKLFILENLRMPNGGVIKCYNIITGELVWEKYPQYFLYDAYFDEEKIFILAGKVKTKPDSVIVLSVDGRLIDTNITQEEFECKLKSHTMENRNAELNDYRNKIAKNKQSLQMMDIRYRDRIYCIESSPFNNVFGIIMDSSFTEEHENSTQASLFFLNFNNFWTIPVKEGDAVLQYAQFFDDNIPLFSIIDDGIYVFLYCATGAVYCIKITTAEIIWKYNYFTCPWPSFKSYLTSFNGNSTYVSSAINAYEELCDQRIMQWKKHQSASNLSYFREIFDPQLNGEHRVKANDQTQLFYILSITIIFLIAVIFRLRRS